MNIWIGLVEIVFGSIVFIWVCRGGINRLFLPLEKLAKDAYRYRWLRARPLDPHFMDGWYVVQVVSDGEREVTKSRNLEDLDTAIDVAMLKMPNV